MSQTTNQYNGHCYSLDDPMDLQIAATRLVSGCSHEEMHLWLGFRAIMAVFGHKTIPKIANQLGDTFTIPLFW